MTLRKIAGLLMAFGLTIGLVGTGVGASFTDQVTATENIEVGTFGCQIDLIGDGLPPSSSITYNAPLITSSAAGKAPFTFTVTNVGSIPQQLTITDGGPDGVFSAMPLLPAGPVVLGASGAQVFDTGIEWTELENTDLGTTGSITWTVHCEEVPAVPEVCEYSVEATGGPHDGLYGSTVTPVTITNEDCSRSMASRLNIRELPGRARRRRPSRLGRLVVPRVWLSKCGRRWSRTRGC